MNRNSCATTTRTALRIEALEDRVTPVTVRFDYSLDTSGYFADANRRAALDRVATAITAQMNDSLQAITPANGNTWTATVYNSVLNQVQSVGNPTIGQDEVLVYIVGGRLSSGALGIASGGAYSASGTTPWLDTVRTRGQTGEANGTDFGTWGGLIAFNTAINWDFTAGNPSANQYDFDTVALHEMMHVFGFGLENPSYERLVSGGHFNGANTVSVYGGSVPMQAGDHSDHFAAGVRYNGQDAVMAPAIAPGVRKQMTALEYAGLRDIGWANGPAATSPPPVAPPVTPPAVTGTSAVGAIAGGLGTFAVGNGTGSPAGVNAYSQGGTSVYSGTGLDAGFTGGERVATGDVNADGVADYTVGAGPGGGPAVRVIDGRTGATIHSFMAFESFFSGGVYVSMGDVNRDGRDDIAVGAGASGGPRVKVYDGATGAQLADFWGIEDINFRGGARVALGDLNGDDIADLVVSAGEGGGPRVAAYNGLTLINGITPTHLFGDFFAFEPTLTNGSYVAVADLNGDGYGDLIAGAGEGGAPRVTVFNGRSLMRGVYTDWVANFFAGSASAVGGVRVAAADVTGDGRDDLITAPGPNSDGTVRVYAGGAFNVFNIAGFQNTYLTLNKPEWATYGAYVG
jgi:FG-GAP repeat